MRGFRTVRSHAKFPGVYWIESKEGRKLATANLIPGRSVYGEERVEWEGTEYRSWDPYRSKLAAAIIKGMKSMPIREGSRVLYLGAATGTTVSHVSDIVGKMGMIYCVEISPRPMRDLLSLCALRENLSPILADARNPQSYGMLVTGVDVIYQDVAQPDQTEILLRNARVFLSSGGWAVFMLKARSIDVTKDPQEIFRGEVEALREEMEPVEVRVLDPYEKDHAMLLLRKK